ncbi:MAG: hypothetical protein M1812_000945 [Candelaria pacifica]|nr:MAG: hypothetical protein M1812_000945 [Candelaria pacifica]
MVVILMTPAMVAAVKQYQAENPQEDMDQEPSLKDPQVGNGISHGQLIDISRSLRANTRSGNVPKSNQEEVCKSVSYSLSDLLRGSQLYTTPPKPRPEPSSEYKALMARLRREEEERAYERMINPLPPPESFAQRFPASKYAQLFPSDTSSSQDDDEITYADIDRQMALIFNVLVSIVACSVAIWLVSSRWSTPQRLGLSMGGSGVVGVAEVVVYAGYLRRLKEAKNKGKKHVEVKEIIKTWTIGGSSEDHDLKGEKLIQRRNSGPTLTRRRPAKDQESEESP